MPAATFLVRAVLAPRLRPKFDHWYFTDHLPWAIRAFKCEKGLNGVMAGLVPAQPVGRNSVSVFRQFPLPPAQYAALLRPTELEHVERPWMRPYSFLSSIPFSTRRFFNSRSSALTNGSPSRSASAR